MVLNVQGSHACCQVKSTLSVVQGIIGSIWGGCATSSEDRDDGRTGSYDTERALAGMVSRPAPFVHVSARLYSSVRFALVIFGRTGIVKIYSITTPIPSAPKPVHNIRASLAYFPLASLKPAWQLS